jgi:hypothetical protein
MTIIIVVIFPIIAVIVERPQEVSEDHGGYLSSLLSRRFVREAEVDALVDTGFDHFLRYIGEPSICAS